MASDKDPIRSLLHRAAIMRFMGRNIEVDPCF
jgi:hypothetical protein